MVIRSYYVPSDSFSVLPELVGTAETEKSNLYHSQTGLGRPDISPDLCCGQSPVASVTARVKLVCVAVIH